MTVYGVLQRPAIQTNGVSGSHEFAALMISPYAHNTATPKARPGAACPNVSGSIHEDRGSATCTGRVRVPSGSTSSSRNKAELARA